MRDGSNIVFFGNCQSEVLCAVYNRYVAVRTGRRARYIQNYAELSADDEELIRNAEIVVEQKLEFAAKTDWGHIATGARLLQVPLISGGFLWPFAGQPHPASKSLDYLGYGPFGGELGDGYLNRLFQAKMPPEAALTQYAGLDIHKTINLDRTLELHLERQRQREHGTGVRMADFIEENFRRELLFHSPFHLSLALVAEYASQFLPELGAEPEDLALMRRALTPGAHRYLVRPSVYLFKTPIHPAVTRHYQLEWAPSDRKYRYFGESGLSFDEYVRRYVGFTWNCDLLEGIHLTYQRQDEEAWAKIERGLARDPKSAEGHFCLALLRLRRDDPAGAIAALRSAAEFDPGDPQYPALLGEVLHRQGAVQAAADAYRDALALDPGNPDYAVKLASALNGSDGPASAIRSLRESLNFAPFAAGLYQALARIELASGLLAEAEQDARTASELEPGSEAAFDLLREALLRQGRTAEEAAFSRPASGAATRFSAEETDEIPNQGSLFENSVTRNETSSSMAKKHLRRNAARRGSAGGMQLMDGPRPRAEQPIATAAAIPAQDTASVQSDIPLPERIAEAIRLRDAGQFEEAETLLSRACQEFADNPAPAIEYARVAEARKDWKEAERRWSHVRENFERNEVAYMGGVIALRQLGEGDAADQLIAEALSKFPGHHWFLHQQAQRAGERRDWRAAEEGWRTSLAANPAGIWWVHAELARALAEQGRIAEAEEVLVRGQELHPTEAGLFVEHARLAERRKGWDEALGRWQSVRNQFPHEPRAFTGIAITHRECGRIGEAEAVLTEAVERFPQDLWTFIEHARLAEARRDTDEALRRWERVREIFPAQTVGYTAAAALLRDALRFEEAESLLAEATQRFPPEPRLEIDRAILAHHRRDWAQAAHRWERVRARLPAERTAYLLGAAALRELGRLDEAEALLSDAVHRFPAEVGARVERVLVAEARGEWTEAAEAWAALRTEFPQDTRGFISGARCLRQLGRTDEAEAVLVDAMGRFPEDPSVLTEYAWLAQIARNWPEAAKRWETVRARHPELPAASIAGAAALREAQRFEEANILLMQAARQFPDDAGVMIERARVLETMRNWEGAAEDWELVRARLPERGEGYTGLATALTQLGRLDEADAVLREGTERVPSAWWLFSHFAEIATIRNDWPAALTRWTEARRRFPQMHGLKARVFEARLRLSEVDPAAAMAAEEEGAAGPGADTMYDLMMAFESLGHGCAFGTLQREYGAEPLGLLRWGAILPQNLIKALDTSFAGVGAPENTEIELRPNGIHSEYWVADKRFGMEMHTFIGEEQISYEKMFAQSCRRMEFLSRKLQTI